jgi:uncharacterized protein YPO0396
MSQLLLEELATIAKANEYDIIKDEYKRLQESEKELRRVNKELVGVLKDAYDCIGMASGETGSNVRARAVIAISKATNL